MTRKAVATRSEDAPRPIGPYSQAVVHNGQVFASGQIPVDPSTNEIVPGGIDAQTQQVLANLRAVLEASGSSFAQVLRTTIYLTDLADFSRVNEI